MKFPKSLAVFAFIPLALFIRLEAGFAQSAAQPTDSEAPGIAAAAHARFARTSPFSLSSGRSVSAAATSELELLFPTNATTSRAVFTMQDDLSGSEGADTSAMIDPGANGASGAGARNSDGAARSAIATMTAKIGAAVRVETFSTWTRFRLFSGRLRKASSIRTSSWGTILCMAGER